MNFINVQTCACQYVHVHTGTYAYMPFLTLFKKSANRSRTRNLVHTSHRVYPCAMGLQTSMPVKITNDVSVYIICFCQTPCQCTWRLMTNRRRRSRSAAAPSHDIPRPSLDVDLVEAELRLVAGLGTCNVPADRSPIEKEPVA